MSVASLIQLAAACVGILGSLFFAIGVLRQTIEAMAKLSGTYFDKNPHMPPALAAQKADYLFGGGLIVLAFVLQLAAFFVPEDPALGESASRIAPIVAASTTVIVFFALRAASKKKAKHYESEINAWLKKHRKKASNQGSRDSCS